MNIAYISLGSNIENRIEHCIKGLDELKGYSTPLDCSSFYETAPVGVNGQNSYINCAAKVKTCLSARDLLKCLIESEIKLGRQSKGDYSPRTLDLDIIFYDDIILETEALVIPHRQAHLRKFVIEPICEIDPDFVHPVLKQTMSEILLAIDKDQHTEKIGKFY